MGTVMLNWRSKYVNDALEQRGERLKENQDESAFESWLNTSGLSPADQQLERMRRRSPQLATVLENRAKAKQQEAWRDEDRADAEDWRQEQRDSLADAKAAEEKQRVEHARGQFDDLVGAANEDVMTEDFTDPEVVAQVKSRGTGTVDEAPGQDEGTDEYGGPAGDNPEAPAKIQSAHVRRMSSTGRMYLAKAMELGKKNGFQFDGFPQGIVGPEEVAQMRKMEGDNKKVAQRAKESKDKQIKVDKQWAGLDMALELVPGAADAGYGSWTERSRHLREIGYTPKEAFKAMATQVAAQVARSEKYRASFKKSVAGVRMDMRKAEDDRKEAVYKMDIAGPMEIDDESGNKVINPAYRKARDSYMMAKERHQAAQKRMMVLESVGAEIGDQYGDQPAQREPEAPGSSRGSAERRKAEEDKVTASASARAGADAGGEHEGRKLVDAVGESMGLTPEQVQRELEGSDEVQGGEGEDEFDSEGGPGGEGQQGGDSDEEMGMSEEEEGRYNDARSREAGEEEPWMVEERKYADSRAATNAAKYSDWNTTEESGALGVKLGDGRTVGGGTGSPNDVYRNLFQEKQKAMKEGRRDDVQKIDDYMAFYEGYYASQKVRT